MPRTREGNIEGFVLPVSVVVVVVVGGGEIRQEEVVHGRCRMWLVQRLGVTVEHSVADHWLGRELTTRGALQARVHTYFVKKNPTARVRGGAFAPDPAYEA